MIVNGDMDNLIRDILNQLTINNKKDQILYELYQIKNDLENIELTSSLKQKLERTNILISKLEQL